MFEKKVKRGDTYIHLSPTEFRLLKMLVKEPGKVFSREVLLKTVWGENIFVESRTVDVHIRRLREIIEKDNIMNKAGLNLPFMIDLSVKLRDYELVNCIEQDKDRMVDLLWK